MISCAHCGKVIQDKHIQREERYFHRICHGDAVKKKILPPIYTKESDIPTSAQFIHCGGSENMLLWEERQYYNWHRAGADSFWSKK